MSHKFLQNETLSMGFTAALSSSSHFLVSTMGSKIFWRNSIWFITGLQYRKIFPNFMSYSLNPIITNFETTNPEFSRFFQRFVVSKSKWIIQTLSFHAKTALTRSETNNKFHEKIQKSLFWNGWWISWARYLNNQKSQNIVSD